LGTDRSRALRLGRLPQCLDLGRFAVVQISRRHAEGTTHTKRDCRKRAWLKQNWLSRSWPLHPEHKFQEILQIHLGFGQRGPRREAQRQNLAAQEHRPEFGEASQDLLVPPHHGPGRVDHLP
jgi:hypothetical protein